MLIRIHTHELHHPAIQHLLSNPNLTDQLRHRHSQLSLPQHPTICSTEKRFLFTANPPSLGNRFCRKLTFTVCQKSGSRSVEAITSWDMTVRHTSLSGRLRKLSAPTAVPRST